MISHESDLAKDYTVGSYVGQHPNNFDKQPDKFSRGLTMAMGFGAMEFLLVLLTMGGPFSQLLGLPPGERDTNLACAAFEDSIMYAEWAARGEGQKDAPGVDGLAADPEVKEFFARLQSAIEKMMVREMGDEGETMKILPEFALALSGHPGCFFVGLDMDEPPADDLPPQMAFINMIRGAMIINGGDEADAIAEKIKTLVQAGTGEEMTKLDHSTLPAPLPISIQLHREGNYIIFSIGNDDDGIDQMVARLKSKSGGIAGNKNFQAAWSELGLKRPGLITFFDIENGTKNIGKLVGPPMVTMGLNMAGLNGARWAMNVTGVVEDKVVCRGMLKGVTGNKGLMALAAGRGIKATDFAMVPDDSDVVFAVSLDAEQIMNEVKTFVGQMDPNAVEEFEAELKRSGEFLGLDIVKDVLQSIDHVVTISNSTADGGWVASSPVLTIGIKNKEGAAKSVKAFADMFAREFDIEERGRGRRYGVTMEKREFQGSQVYMINTIGNDEIPVAPTWCLTDSHFVFALHPQALKSRLRRTGEDGFKVFSSFEGGPKGEAFAFSAMKMKDVLPRIYGFMPWVGQILASEMQQDGFEMNLFDVPSARALLPYMSDARSWAVRSSDGISFHNEGPPLLGNLPSMVPAMIPPFLFFGRVEPQFIIEAPADAAF